MDPVGVVFLILIAILLIASIILPRMEERRENEE